MSLKDIIQRLEKATGPDREIDEAIMGYLGLIPALGGYYGWERTSPGYFSRPTNGEGTQFENAAAALYTSSVDAALTLVPEGADVEIKRARHRKGWFSSVWWVNPNPRTKNVLVRTGDASTAALAVAIAALKARGE